jgi:hypothetical protein
VAERRPAKDKLIVKDIGEVGPSTGNQRHFRFSRDQLRCLGREVVCEASEVDAGRRLMRCWLRFCWLRLC